MTRNPLTPRARPNLETLEERCVLSAAPLLQSQPALIPNDPLFGQQWDMRNSAQSGGKADADIDADNAWGVSSKSRITTAVVDSGIDYTHPDLYLNVWLNQGEIPAAIRPWLIDLDSDGLITFRDLNDARNRGAGKITDLNGNGIIDAGDILKPVSQGGWADGVSNDGDAYKDDLVGWNFLASNNDPMDSSGHGTHVSGTIGAVGNNGIGVAGIAWNTQIMGLRGIDAAAGGTTDTISQALDYASTHGAKVVNGSWALSGPSAVLKAALDRAQARGVVVVVAAGNYSTNLDTTPYYPASYTNSNIVSVAATDNQDKLASYSSYGGMTVDIAAPGTNILSTNLNKAYGNRSGTSMATPHVAGAIALVWSQHPEWTYQQAIAQVLSTADRLPSLNGKVASGRLNVGAAMQVPSAPSAPASTVSPVAAASLSAWVAAAGWQDVVKGDFDGDGKDELLGRVGYSQWWVARFVGASIVPTMWAWWSESAGWHDVVAGDFDGDGKDDFAARTWNGEWWVGRSSGASFSPAFWAPWSEPVGWRDVRVGDFNGDGKADIAGRTSYGQWWVGISTGSYFSTTLWAWWSEPAGWHDVQVGDFNGDGKTDIAARTYYGQWWVGLSTGAWLNTTPWAEWSEPAGWRDTRVGDFNGDGKADIASRTSDGQWWVGISTGSWYSTTMWAQWSEPVGWRDVQVGDFDGDGKADIVASTSYGQWWIARSRNTLFSNALWM